MSAGSGAAASAAEDLMASWTELQLAVIDRLSRAEDDDPARAARPYRLLLDGLSMLSASTRAPGDPRQFEEARQRLVAYWDGFQHILDLRRKRDRLSENSLQPVTVDLRLRLQRFMNSGRANETAVAGDGVISMLLVQQHVDRYILRRDSDDIDRARRDLETVRRRIEELGRLPLEPSSRPAVGEVAALLGSYAIALEQLNVTINDEVRQSEALDRVADEVKAALVALPVESDVQGSVPAPARSAAPASVNSPVPSSPHGGGLSLEVAVVGVIALLFGALIAWLVIGRRPAVVREIPAAPEPDPSGAVVVQTAPPPVALEPEPAETEIVAEPDWLAGMGRMMAVLHAGGSGAEPARELLEAKASIEARNRAMAGFLVSMSEHLEGPLAAIMRHGDQLMNELDRNKIHHLTPDVEMIQWSGEQLLRMIEGLRARAEIETGTLTVTSEDFLVEHLLTEVRERVRPLTNLYGNRLSVQAARGIGLMHSDFAKLRSALVHLLENACKFSENGDVTLVVMRVEEDGRSMIRFTVTDTGVGIAAGDIERIFEPFVSLGTGRTRGVGLGLALVHSYAECLGGTIVVDSTPGRGSCFVLTLPAAPTAAELSVLQLEGS
ncbi:MAG: HAMP domain-containing sensor histidine kinase [Rhodospirillaceae bacterium]